MNKAWAGLTKVSIYLNPYIFLLWNERCIQLGLNLTISGRGFRISLDHSHYGG